MDELDENKPMRMKSTGRVFYPCPSISWLPSYLGGVIEDVDHGYAMKFAHVPRADLENIPKPAREYFTVCRDASGNLLTTRVGTSDKKFYAHVPRGMALIGVEVDEAGRLTVTQEWSGSGPPL